MLSMTHVVSQLHVGDFFDNSAGLKQHVVYQIKLVVFKSLALIS